ncbi:MAG: DUF1311 domain-containing protein [Lachnospiraceae bacterium]|nr:DUF1311 domain-containing protein [Lachnospiraceae bacterium]
MKRKLFAVLLSVTMIAVLCTGCNKSPNVETIATPAVEETQTNDVQTEDNADSESKNSNVSIQEEMEAVEASYQDLLNSIDSESATQLDMNQNAAAAYQLWDDELNALWDRLSDEVDAQKKEDLLGAQRQWNEKKEIEIKNAGEECEGGSLQPLLECSKGAELTRARCYYLAGLLAEVRGEGFATSDEVQADLDAANPTLD